MSTCDPGPRPVDPITSHCADGRRSLVLLGTGTSLRRAPWTDTTRQFWGPAYLAPTFPRLDVAFEIHDDEQVRSADNWAGVVQCRAPIYMQRPYDELPTSRAGGL